MSRVLLRSVRVFLVEEKIELLERFGTMGDDPINRAVQLEHRNSFAARSRSVMPSVAMRRERALGQRVIVKRQHGIGGIDTVCPSGDWRKIRLLLLFKNHISK